MRRLSPLLIWIALTTPAFAQAPAPQAIDYVSLGATLLKDGYNDRARAALDKVDVRAENFDFARYYTLKGMLQQKLSYPELSNRFFQAALVRGQDNPTVHLFMARNHWQLRAYPAVIEALELAGEATDRDPQMLVILAEAYKQLGELPAAWTVLDRGISNHPEFAGFYRQKFFYLLEVGFYRRALEYAQQYLSAKAYSAKDYLAVAFALRENKQLDGAASLLEEALLKYRGDPKLIELLGQVYIDQQQYTMAAMVFDRASLIRPEFAHQAASLYLKAGQAVRAMQLNRRIVDQREKFRQRIGIDIELDDYESLVTKLPALRRYDLLADERIAYAVAYAYFRNGEFAEARRYLGAIADRELFAKSARIVQQMERCKEDPLECP